MRLSSRTKKIGIIVILGIILFLALNLTSARKEIKNFFYLISSPIQKWFWQTGEKVSAFFTTITEIKNLKRENEELKLKIQELLSENISLKELKKENEILRTALNIGLEKEFSLVFAQVIGKDIAQDSIFINKGSKDGILKNSPVITQQKILVGKISEVYKNFSKVMLLSNKESSFDVKILDTEIYGVVKGKGNFKIFLDFVPQEKEIKKGDLVITSMLGGIFPKGLLVGEIIEVKKSDVEPFQQAELKPAFNIDEIENLFIITKF